MSMIQVFWYYLIWHYTTAWTDIFRLFNNYLWFVGNFFSIELLFKTLFSPWRRLSISGGKGSKDSFFGAILVNTFMRGVGFFIRSFTILAGCVALFIFVTVSALLICIWAVLPAIIFLLFFGGVGQILKSFF